MLFSQRIGLKPVKDTLQVNDIDMDLRNSLWNVFSVEVWRWLIGRMQEEFCIALWRDYFKKQIDDIPFSFSGTSKGFHGVYTHVRKYYNSAEWNEVYDFLEFCTDYAPSSYTISCNAVLKRELSGYRFIGKQLTPIVNESEMESINEAAISEFPNVAKHIDTAITLFSDRKNPDYRNSIKESISGVEAMCNNIQGTTNATLGEALKAIEKQGTIELHAALKGAFEKLYGYTSDSKTGIRHMLMDEPNIGFEDAKYMLVSCSAFINYLKDKLSKIR